MAPQGRGYEELDVKTMLILLNERFDEFLSENGRMKNSEKAIISHEKRLNWLEKITYVFIGAVGVIKFLGAMLLK